MKKYILLIAGILLLVLYYFKMEVWPFLAIVPIGVLGGFMVCKSFMDAYYQDNN